MAHPDVHALAGLFCFDLARLATRLDDQGVLVPLEDQERSRWDRALVERGVQYLARSATGDHMSRCHLEAGIACEHAIAPSLEATDWDRIVAQLGRASVVRAPAQTCRNVLATAARSGFGRSSSS